MKAYVFFGVDAEKPGCVMKFEHLHFYFCLVVDSQTIIGFKCVGDNHAIELYFESMLLYWVSEMVHIGIKEVVLQNGRRLRSSEHGCDVISVDKLENDNLIQKFKDSLALAGIKEVEN